MTEFRVGALVDDRYELRERLGEGGFAETWLAHDQITQSKRLIKHFFTPALAKDWARREYYNADRLNHDRCARVYDMQETPDYGYLVLEYIEGHNFETYVQIAQPSAEDFRSIFIDVLEALDYIHAHGLIHRDVTPRNIIVTGEGDAKLIDFGLVSTENARTAAGTKPYMAPEVAAGRGATQRSDLYSFAVTAVRMMLGRLPYAGDLAKGTDNREALEAPTDEERSRWSGLGLALLDVLYRAVAFDPADRPDTARELRELLRMAQDIQEPGGARNINPVINDLRMLYRGSSQGNPGNRGLDDGFARDTYIPTKLDKELLPAIVAGELRLVVLTGNPGDGKTSFLVQVGQALKEKKATVLEEDEAGWRMRLGGHTFVAVYDASESHDSLSSDELVRRALDPSDGEDTGRHTALLAVNDGRLLRFFTDHEDLYPAEAREIRRQLQGEPAEDSSVALVDLKRRTLAPIEGVEGLALEVLSSFTEAEGWAVCDTCLSRDVCPMFRNALTLRADGRKAIGELVLTSHLRRRRRATFRDVRSALGWLITGDKSCDEVHDERERGLDSSKSSTALLHDLAFDQNNPDYLIQEWAELDPAAVAAPDVERAARVRTRPTDPVTASEARRRLFVGSWTAEGIDRDRVNAYRYLDEFSSALAKDSGQGEKVRDRLLLGLSRILGAAGYTGPDLALSDGSAGGTWAVLKELPADQFQLEVVGGESKYLETRADALRLTHGPASLSLTLDTAELILRAADGELLGDSESAAVRQEIEWFASELRRRQADVVRVVEPSGRSHTVRSSDGHIRLET